MSMFLMDWVDAPPGSALEVTVLPLKTYNLSSSTPPFPNLDLSAFGAGDILCAIYGPYITTASATYEAAAMTLHTASGGVSGGRLTLYTRTLTGVGGPTDEIVVTLLTSTSAHLLAVFVISGGQIAGVDTSRGTEAERSATVTPTKASNVILAFTMGATTTFGDGINWTNATEQRQNSNVILSTGESYARVNNVAVAARTVTATASGAPTGQRGLMVIAIEDAD